MRCTPQCTPPTPTSPRCARYSPLLPSLRAEVRELGAQSCKESRACVTSASPVLPPQPLASALSDPALSLTFGGSVLNDERARRRPSHTACAGASRPPPWVTSRRSSASLRVAASARGCELSAPLQAERSQQVCAVEGRVRERGRVPTSTRRCRASRRPPPVTPHAAAAASALAEGVLREARQTCPPLTLTYGVTWACGSEECTRPCAQQLTSRI